jgi:hypothetical protein
MSRDKDRPRNYWEDEDEDWEIPRSFPDAYRNAANQNRPRPRQNNTPQDGASEIPSRSGRTRPRSGPGGGRIYEEGNERPTRPRPTRQSRDEVYSRHRQRPRQPIYSRDQEETHVRPPARTQKTEPPTPRRERPTNSLYPKTEQPAPRRERPTNSPYQSPPSRHVRDEIYPDQQLIPRRTQRISDQPPGYSRNEQYEEYEEYEEYQGVQPRQRQPERRPPQRHHKRERGGRIFSNILVGCVGSLITLALIIGVIGYVLLTKTPLGQNLGKSPHTHQNPPQILTLSSTTPLIVRNQIGNVTISVDQNTPNATLVSTKNVQAGSDDEANRLFNQIMLTTNSIHRGEDTDCVANTCLLITATLPSTNNSVSMDLTITLPTSFSDPSNPYTITASTVAGTLAVTNFTGILNLSNKKGGKVDINVTHTGIFPGSCLQTTEGSINVNQGNTFFFNPKPQMTPCTTNRHSTGAPWFRIIGGTGDVNIALMPSYTQLQLDVHTNQGKITDDFGLQVDSSGGEASYSGPLIPHANTTPDDPLLYITTSTGNINIQKQQLNVSG